MRTPPYAFWLLAGAGVALIVLPDCISASRVSRPDDVAIRDANVAPVGNAPGGASAQLPPRGFRELSFEAALTAAAAERKPLLIEFCADWSTDTQRLEQATFTDRRLLDQLSARTVPIQVDVMRASALSTRYHIKSLPTVMLLTGDGTELCRWVGFFNASAFSDELTQALAGSFPIQRAQAKLKSSDAVGHFNLAKNLAEDGSYPEALQEFLWLYDVRPVLSVASLLLVANGWAAQPPDTHGDSEIVELSPFLVIAPGRGVIPVVPWMRVSRFSRKRITPLKIASGPFPEMAPERHGLKPGEKIVAVDGRAVMGMSLATLRAIWTEGDVGEPATFVVQGIGAEESIFREVVIKHIVPPKSPAPVPETKAR